MSHIVLYFLHSTLVLSFNIDGVLTLSILTGIEKTWTCLSHMMTSSNGNIFRVTGHIPSEFPAQRPVTRSFDVFFDLRLNKRLGKQWWGWWFETLSRPLWRHRNEQSAISLHYMPCDIYTAACFIVLCLSMLYHHLIRIHVKQLDQLLVFLRPTLRLWEMVHYPVL